MCSPVADIRTAAGSDSVSLVVHPVERSRTDVLPVGRHDPRAVHRVQLPRDLLPDHIIYRNRIDGAIRTSGNRSRAAKVAFRSAKVALRESSATFAERKATLWAKSRLTWRRPVNGYHQLPLRAATS
jgi:hypothetical protein